MVQPQLPASASVGGESDGRFAAVGTAFAANFADRGETGAAVAVWHQGRLVADLWGGWADVRAERPWSQDSLQLVFSTTKGLASVAVLSLIDAYGFDIDAPVGAVWPEFAANGKGAITTRHLLCHRSGLAAFADRIEVAECHVPGAAAARLAGQAAEWGVDSHGYHAVTFGFLLGEVVARVTGMSLGQYWRTRFAEPMGLETWIGLPPEQEHRVTRLRNLPAGPADAAKEPFQQALLTKGSLTRRVFTNPDQNMFNDPALHAAEWPAANGITTARALAQFYGALGGGKVLSAAVLAEAQTTQAEGEDLVLLAPTRFGHGFQLPTTPGVLPAGSFGHNGAGGSVAFAVPEHDLAFAYVMTSMDQTSAVDPRAKALVDAVMSCV
jgi:CubicO group peptidase (beta-lactamase class C family)